MLFTPAFEQSKACAEFGMQCVRCIPRCRQTTTSHRAVLGECRHEHVPSNRNCAPHLRDVESSVLRVGDEMKDRSVVPQVATVPWQSCGQDVTFDPGDKRRGYAQSSLCMAQGSRRQVEHRDLPIPGCDEAVDQR